jgi:hypothetical protein
MVSVTVLPVRCGWHTLQADNVNHVVQRPSIVSISNALRTSLSEFRVSLMTLKVPSLSHAAAAQARGTVVHKFRPAWRLFRPDLLLRPYLCGMDPAAPAHRPSSGMRDRTLADGMMEGLIPAGSTREVQQVPPQSENAASATTAAVPPTQLAEESLLAHPRSSFLARAAEELRSHQLAPAYSKQATSTQGKLMRGAHVPQHGRLVHKDRLKDKSSPSTFRATVQEHARQLADTRARDARRIGNMVVNEDPGLAEPLSAFNVLTGSLLRRIRMLGKVTNQIWRPKYRKQAKEELSSTSRPLSQPTRARLRSPLLTWTHASHS